MPDLLTRDALKRGCCIHIGIRNRAHAAQARKPSRFGRRAFTRRYGIASAQYDLGGARREALEAQTCERALTAKLRFDAALRLRHAASRSVSLCAGDRARAAKTHEKG
jgi:hypothetical protein